MTPEEIAQRHLPYHTTCPAKRKKIDWQREQLARDIRANFVQMTSTLSGVQMVYTSKAELK